jgi:hypothetical protein
MKRIKTSQWVPVDSEGLKWAYYKPGEQGNRAAHGYVWTRSDGYCEVHVAGKHVFIYTDMSGAADYLYAESLRRKS